MPAIGGQMAKKQGGGQSGGISFGGSVGNIGNIVMGDQTIKTVTTSTTTSVVEINKAFKPLEAAIAAAPAEKAAEAQSTLTALKDETAKGEKADDGVMSRLINGLVDLVPSATSAVVGIFATPILGALAGPATKAVLDMLRGK